MVTTYNSLQVSLDFLSVRRIKGNSAYVQSQEN